MRKTRKQILSYLILLTFALTNVVGSIGVIPVHAEGNKPIQSRDSKTVEQSLEGQAIRGIPELTAVPATQEDIDALDSSSGTDSISFRSLPALNSTKTFYVYNITTKSYDAVTSVLRRIGAHSYVYLQQGNETVTDEMLDDTVVEFESIYSTNISIFGAPPDIDNDKRVNILLLDIQDFGGGSYIAGFFDSRSELPRMYHNTAKNQSNECEIFFMDIVEGLPDTVSARLNFFCTLAHEFQHMIQYEVYLSNYTSINEYEATWLNEAFSCFAEYLNYNEHPLGQIEYYLGDYLPDNEGLTNWKTGSLASYGASYMFALYMYEQFGEAFISNLAQDPEVGIDSIDNQLAANGINMDFYELFEKSQVAAAVDGDGEFGYSTIDIPSIRQVSYNDTDYYPDMRFYSLSTSGAYNGTPEPISTYGGSFRSYAGFLDGSKTESAALNVLFGNNTGSYYIVKPDTLDAANTYDTFSAAPKIIEKIESDTLAGNKIEFGDNQWAMLIYIAKGTAIENTITVTTTTTPDPDTAPSTPQNLLTYESCNTVGLTWSPSSFTGGVKGYNVYRNDVMLNTKGLVLTTSYTDRTVNPSTGYTYKVEAVGYDSSTSARAEVWTITSSIPENYAEHAPILSLIDTAASSIIVKLTAPMGYTNIDRFEIITLLDGMEDSYYDLGDTPGNFELMGFEDEITYTLYAFAVDFLGNYSPASNRLYVKSGATGGEVSLSEPPTVPTDISATAVKETKLTLEWTPSVQAEGIYEYNVYRDNVFVGKTEGNTAQFTDTSLTASTSYTYTIEAVGNDSKKLNSDYSAPFTVVTTSGPPSLTADTTSNNADNSLEVAFADNAIWRSSISQILVDGTPISEAAYSVSPGAITINAGTITAGDHTITVVADGYSDTQVNQAVTPGAISASTSTAEIDQPGEPLAVGSTRTVTLTARDQYDNVIQGHQFYVTATVYDGDATTNEIYTIDGTGYDTTTENIAVGSITAANGQTTVQITVPADVDANDGLAVQFKTVTGLSPVGHIGIHFNSFKSPPVLWSDTTNANVDNTLELLFTDDAAWRAAIATIKVDYSTPLSPTDYSISPGCITINQGVLQTKGTYTISVYAVGYSITSATQAIDAGAINAANSAAEIDLSLTAGTTSTVTLTARDQYNNLIQGHQFYADLSVIDNNAARNESYTIGSIGHDSSAANIKAGSLTDASGQATEQVTIPAAIDAADGIIIQFKTASGGTNVGSSFSNLQAPPSLTADTSSNNVDNDLQITFADDASWRSAITAVKVDTTTLSESTDYSISAGEIKIKQGVITISGNHSITVYAIGYNNANVTQLVTSGAISSVNSVMAVSPSPAAGITSQVTLTARDQYNNVIQGHQFYADITVMNNIPANNETYGVGGLNYNSTTTNIAVGAVTNSAGKTTVDLSIPAILDTNDGVLIQFKTASGGDNIGTAVSCKGVPELTADSTHNNVDNDLQITFADDPTWGLSITSVKVDSTALLPAQYSIAGSILTIKQGVIKTSGSHTITITATGYIDAIIEQAVSTGAVTANNSTASINQSLGAGTAGTVTLTAKDQYGNPVQGHQFYMDITIINNTADTVESYTVDGIAYTASAAGIAVLNITDGTGRALVGILTPASIDYSDGISLQFKLTSGGSAIGSPISYTKPKPSTSGGGGGKKGGGGGGGGGTSAATPKPAAVENIVTAEAVNEQIANTSASTVTININGTSSTQTAVIPANVLGILDSKKKSITIVTNDTSISFVPEIVGSDIGSLAKDSSLRITVNKLNSESEGILPGTSDENSKGLFRVGNSIFQFEANLVSENGTTSLRNFNKDITITISLKDTDLSSIDTEKLGIYYFNEKTKEWEYVGGKYDPVTKTITFSTNHFSYFTVMKYEKSFSDINGHWAQADIEKLASKHIFRNIAGEQFKPQAKITRAEFIAMLVRALELKADGIEPISFKDITEDKYYYGEVMTAWKLGITTGDDTGKFRPGDNITREQLAAMIVRALAYLEKSPVLTEEQINVKLGAYTDRNNVSSYAKNAIAIALEKKIINGWTSSLLAPKENATRAEAAVMIRRLLRGL